jgi:hypothetical protein
MNRRILLAALSVGVFFFAGMAHAANIKEGKWSMTTTMHMDGMDNQMAQAQKEMESMSPEDKAMMEQMMGGMGMKMGGPAGGITTTTTQCITNDNPVPEASSEDNCTETHNIKGNTVNFDVHCDTSRSTGKVTYNNESMKGTIDASQTENGQERKMKIDINGKYMGPCDDASAAPNGSNKALSLREKELELKEKELQLKQRELDMQSASTTTTTTTTKTKGKPSLNDVNNAVNTTNNVKNTFSGFRSLLGR